MHLTLQLLKRQLASSEEREREMREKLKELRLELHNASRQLDFAKRKGQALSVEKSALEASAEHDKSTLRKLEHRLAVANGGEAAQAKLAKYRAQVHRLPHSHPAACLHTHALSRTIYRSAVLCYVYTDVRDEGAVGRHSSTSAALRGGHTDS